MRCGARCSRPVRLSRRRRSRGAGQPASTRAGARARRRRCGRSARRRRRRRRPSPCPSLRASDSRSSARARNTRVRTVAAGMARHSAASSIVISSTSRRMNAVRKASGSASILRSSRRRSSRAHGAALRRCSVGSSPMACSIGSHSRRGRSSNSTTTLSRRRARSRAERLVDDDARQPGRQARVAAELAEVPVSREIRFLQDVFGIGVVADDRAGGPKERRVVQAHELLERGRGRRRRCARRARRRRRRGRSGAVRARMLVTWRLDAGDGRCRSRDLHRGGPASASGPQGTPFAYRLRERGERR